MKRSLQPGRHRSHFLACALALLSTVGIAPAFPPAPPHLVFGMVRDEMGQPLTTLEAEVLLEASETVITRTTLIPGMEPGVNYRLSAPLDSGVTPDLYKPTALRPTVPFRMKVRLNGQTYLPIEMTGAANLWTRPGAVSRVDLTLGVDSDSDGLPDAWELALLHMMGIGGTLADIRPGDDADADGISNLDEYLAGTYAFDPADGFVLDIVALADQGPVLQFLAIRGRSYSVHGSEDMHTWTPVPFLLATDAGQSTPRLVYQATETSLIQATTVSPNLDPPVWRFFKLEVQ